jgi:hypothetical protein
MLIKALKRALPVLVLSIAVAAVYGAYIYFVGIPRTSARHLYNEAQQAFKAGNISTGLQKLDQAYAAWPETYIAQERAGLKSTLE